MENKSSGGVFMFVLSSSDIREKSNDELAQEISEAVNGAREGGKS